MNLDDLTIDEVRAIQIADIRARLAARTQGSWIATLDNDGWCVSSVPDEGAPTQRMETLARLSSGSPTSDTSDACFIASAPDDITTLLAEVERLQLEASHYLANLGTAEILKSSWQRERERLQKLLSDAGDAMRKARVENKFLRERNRRDEAVSLLAEQEWITDRRECLVYCIYCGQPESKGHDEYCRAFGREGIVTGCLEEKAELTARFEAMMNEIDAATKGES